MLSPHVRQILSKNTKNPASKTSAGLPTLGLHRQIWPILGMKMSRLMMSSKSPQIFGKASTSQQGNSLRKLASDSSSTATPPSAERDGRNTPFTRMWEHHKPSYRPGTDTYAYDNPWPKLNKGRFDWLFQDGYRRPLAKDQGAKLRKEWIPYGWDVHDEYEDWADWHRWNFFSITIVLVWFSCIAYNWIPDRAIGERDWCQREAFMELARREAEGLSFISKDYIDPTNVALSLPSDEELGTSPIII